MRAAALTAMVFLAVGFGASPCSGQTVKIVTSPHNIFYADCMADSMASRCQIDTGDADLLALRPDPIFSSYPAIRQSRSMGIAGQVSLTKVVEVGAFQIGDISLPHIEAEIKGPEDTYSRVGLKLFRSWGRATFDFRAGEIKAEAPSPDARCATPFNLTSGIRIPVAVSGNAMEATWDTGANYTVVSDAYIAANPDAFELVQDGTSGSDSGAASIRTRVFRMKTITICGCDLTDLDVIAVDMSGPTAAEPGFPQMLVGANLMVGHRWAFDFHDRAWSFD